MRNVLLVARRELQAYVTTLLGYIIGCAVLWADGMLFNWYVLTGGPQLSTRVLEGFFYIAAGTTMIASIFLSMRLLAEERQTGSLVLLMTSPVREWEIVLGKFLSALAFLGGITLLSVYMPLLIFVNGRVSVGHIISGYLGLMLLGGASLAIGLLGSALGAAVPRFRVVTALVASSVMMLFMLLAWKGSEVSEPPLDQLFQYLALYNKHFVPFQSGIVGLSHVLYYLSVMFLFLLASTKVLEARRWR
jgi:ABC-2 type transport system permease protein